MFHLKATIMKRRFFIRTLMIGSGTVLIGSQRSSAEGSKNRPVKLTMLYNNVGNAEALSSKWGLSVLVETHEDSLLFDTGGEAKVLWENMQNAGIDIQKISKVVISHNHWDHVNGLDTFIEQKAIHPKVFVPEYNLDDIKHNFKGLNLTGIKEPTQLNSAVWSTGQLATEYKSNAIHEQSLIVMHDDSIYILTGCSHPGIVKIVERAKSMFSDKKIKLVAGGFHMINYTDADVKAASESLKKLEVEKISPSHCTGEKAIAIFKDQWSDDFIDFNLEENQIEI